MKTSPRTLTRRAFVRRLYAAIALPYAVPASAFARPGAPAPSSRITLGMIGLGSMGLRHVDAFLLEKDCRILAACDVDARRLETARNRINQSCGNSDCLAFADFRDLIARPDIDALCISTPDHWHAIPAMMGIRAGKAVYGEKPLALTIREGQMLVDAVNRYHCVWQTGSWQRSTAHFRFACELVRNGRIGKVHTVQIGIGAGFQPPGGKVVYELPPQPPMPVPDGFDYDMWLGPAPWAAYTEQRCHWNFRWILDYAGGQTTDWGTHHVDIALWGIDADRTGPLTVEGAGAFPRNGLWNAAADYHFHYTFANGVSMHVGSTRHYPQGVRFIGPDGWVHVTRAGTTANPQSLLRETIGPNEINLPRPAGNERQGHRRDFLDCIRSRNKTIADAQVGHTAATACHLANIAMITGRKLRWNPNTQQITNDPHANRMLARPSRAPWRL